MAVGSTLGNELTRKGGKLEKGEARVEGTHQVARLVRREVGTIQTGHHQTVDGLVTQHVAKRLAVRQGHGRRPAIEPHAPLAAALHTHA